MTIPVGVATAGAGAAGGSSAGSIAGAAAVGGGLLGGLLDFPIQKSYLTKQSRHARKWMEYMSNTAYQRAVTDLTAAGLNPMLAYTQGGASTPGYPMTGAPSADFGTDLSGAINAAQKIGKYSPEMGILRNQESKSQAEAHSAKATARVADQVAHQGLVNQKLEGDNLVTEGQRLAEDTALKASQRALNGAATLNTMANTELTGVRRRAEAMAIPYSPEQEAVVRRPFQHTAEGVRRAGGAAKRFLSNQWRRFLEGAKASAKEVEQ